MAIGNDNDIHDCVQAECRAEKGSRFGFCHFLFDTKYDDYKLVDLTISDNVSYDEINVILEEYGQEQVKKALKLQKN